MTTQERGPRRSTGKTRALSAALFAALVSPGCTRPASPAPSDAPPASGSPAVTAAASPAAPLASGSAAPADSASAGGSEGKPLPLPGAAGAVSMDYIGVDREEGRVWVPAGPLGAVAVLSTATGAFSRVDGFVTTERPGRGNKMRVVGPSSVSFAPGYAFVGNRGDQSVCSVDSKAMKLGACLKLSSSPDGVAYVAAVKEVWVTTPDAKTITILDAANPARLAQKTTIKLGGDPEGFAIDEGRGLFYTNLEDRDRTLVIDARTRRVVATWQPHCGEAGPRGLALDPARQQLVVACTEHVQILDAAHDGALLGRIDTGGGVDNIDYLPRTHRVYAAAGKAATLTVAELDDKGALKLVATAKSAPGARTVVVDDRGVAYLADSAGGRLLSFAVP